MKLIATIALASLSFTAESAVCNIDPWQGSISHTEYFCCYGMDGSTAQHVVAKVKSVNDDNYSVKSGASNDPNYCGDSPPTMFDEESYSDNFEHTYDHSVGPVHYSTQSIVLIISCHNAIEDCQIAMESMSVGGSQKAQNASVRVINSTRSNIGTRRSHDVVSDDCLSGPTCSSTGTFNCDESITINDEKYCCCPTGGNFCTSASACQGGSTPKDQSDLGMRRFGGSKSKFNRTLKF